MLIQTINKEVLLLVLLNIYSLIALFYKPITLNLRGAAASNKRPLLASLKGCYFFIDTHAEGYMLSLLGMGFPVVG